jgi:hypothetical protein
LLFSSLLWLWWLLQENTVYYSPPAAAAAALCCCACSQAVAAAEAYIQQHGLHDVQVEVETSSLDQVQQVRPEQQPLELSELATLTVCSYLLEQVQQVQQLRLEQQPNTTSGLSGSGTSID